MSNNAMTPEQRIKRQILIDADAHAKDGVRVEITADNVDALFNEANKDWGLQDDINGFRYSGTRTPEIPAPISRHYEADSVARQLDDGSWVGWAYWHGGGKYGEPEAIDWMGGAYELEIAETKTGVVYVFKKVTVAA
jgi:hypothetical protein